MACRSWSRWLRMSKAGPCAMHPAHTYSAKPTCSDKDERLLQKKSVFDHHKRWNKTWVSPDGSKFVTPFKEHEVSDIHDGTADGPFLVDNNEAEYFIIGGGLMGLSFAYHLWRFMESQTVIKASKHLAPTIMVVEKDPTMEYASSPRSVASCRQQFSHPANVRMSLLSAEFFRNVKFELGVAGHDLPDIQFQPQGYLFLASENGSKTLMRNYETQTKEGAKVMLLTQNKLKEVFPWINTEGIELATYGLENEGWYDTWSLMNALKVKNESLGIKYVQGEVVGFKRKDLSESQAQGPVHRVHEAAGRKIYKTDDLIGAYVKVPGHDKPVYVKCHVVCNSAGPWSGKVSTMLDLGVEEPFAADPILKTALPVEPRKRWVYTFHCPDGPIFDCPLVVDPSGAYFRREGHGGMYLCGMSPPNDDEVDHTNLEVDYDFFHQEVWPRVARRVPVFEKLKLKSAWSGYYEYNTFDQNAVIGPHPYYDNFLFLTGFSGHGAQMAPGASKCLAEWCIEGPKRKNCQNVNVKAFSFDRLVEQQPMVEMNIV